MPLKIKEFFFSEGKRSNLDRYKNHGMLGIPNILCIALSFLFSSVVRSPVLNTTVQRKNDNDIFNHTPRMN